MKRQYVRYPKIPLDKKISLYLECLAEGWSITVSRARSGLKNGRVDYFLALRDPRVQEAHLRNRQTYLEKQRNKITD